MFIGQYQHSIDEKGRLAIPAKFRRELSGEAVVTKGLDGCLFVFTKAKFGKMAVSVSKLPYVSSSARSHARLILAGAQDVEFDKQGRAIIPQYLREYAGLKTHAVVAGLYDRIEIWSSSAWKKENESVEAKAGEIAEKLSSIVEEG